MERRPNRRVHPSVVRVLANTGIQLNAPVGPGRSSFKSLDRSLKSFLRSSNLPGLEYRLRVAGFNSLNDLAEADENVLCAHGFTPMMARRLLQALEEYVLRQLNKIEEKQLPFQLVRKGQKINATPTDKMKELPTYGKQNVKRQRAPEKKATKSSKSTKKGETASRLKPPKRPVSVVRLMSEDTVPTEPIFPNVSMIPNAEFEIFGTEDELAERTGSASPALDRQSPALDRHSPTLGHHSPVIQQLPPASDSSVALSMPHVDSRTSQLFQEFLLPRDMIDSSDRRGIGTWEKELKRSQSVPPDYHFFAKEGHAHRCGWGMVTLTPSFSCPSALSASIPEVESLLSNLGSSDDVGVLLRTLQRLLVLLKEGGESVVVEVVGGGGVEMVLEVLVSMCGHPGAAEASLKILKHLSRLGDVVSLEGMGVVFNAMDCHPDNKVVLTQASLVLGNIGRSGPVECALQLVSDKSLQVSSHALKRFSSSISLLVSVMAMLGVGLGRCTPDDRLHLISDHGKILDSVVIAMSNYPDHAQLLCYASSFIALLIAEVSVCIESGVMELLACSVCQAANCPPVLASSPGTRGVAECNNLNHLSAEGGRESEDSVALMVWVCKALANSASNAALSDDKKLASRCCDVLVEALSLYPQQVPVWLNALYAILQILSSNKIMHEYLARSNLPSLLKSPPTFFPEEGETYIEQLHHYLSHV